MDASALELQNQLGSLDHLDGRDEQTVSDLLGIEEKIESSST